MAVAFIMVNTCRNLKTSFSAHKDHFSLTELKSYAKDIGYDEVDAFFTEDPITHNFVKLESDSQLYNFVKDLWSGSSIKLFLKHVTDKEGVPLLWDHFLLKKIIKNWEIALGFHTG